MEFNNKTVKIEILMESAPGDLTHSDIKLFFCVKGTTEIICGTEISLLVKEGIKLVNEREKHRYILKEDSLAAVFYINSAYISYITAKPSIRFQLDSSRPPEYDYGLLRSLLKRILAVYTWQRWQEKLKEQEYFCGLTELLLKNYAVWDFRNQQEDENSEDRTRMIIEFIHGNYNRQIGLGDLAEQFHLSVPYLSKYIKKNLHAGFLEYLNSVRLSHTVDDLMLTDHSVTRIAFDNGFSNLASFNRVFKDTFSVTPSEYRRKNSRKISREKKRDAGMTLLRDYLTENDKQMPEIGVETRVKCIIDAALSKNYTRIWEQLWNLGSAEELLRADVQRHILLMQKELGMKTVHIWGLFSEEMLIRLEKGENYNFSRIDQVLDFLVLHHMSPMIDLGFHPVELYSAGKTILYREKEKGYEEPEQYLSLIREFADHCVARYGEYETAGWQFEISKDDRLFLHGGASFFQMYESVSLIIRERVPEARVGGGAIFVYDDLSILKEFLSGWKSRRSYPDFLSVWVYPYELVLDDEKEKKLIVSGNPDYICSRISAVQNILKEYGNVPLYVTRWDISLSCRNYLNESCYRGASLIKNIVSCLGKAEVMSCFGSTDLLCDFYDTAESIFGGYGLITKDGIGKPAFYALRFLQSMGKYFVARDENYFITKDDRGNYYMIVFNCCRMDMLFYQNQKEDISAEEVERLFEKDTLEIQIIFRNMKKGKYHIKKSCLGSGKGNILDNWKQLGYGKRLEKDEVRYLSSVCIPKLEYEELEAKKDSLAVNASLCANEIQLYKIRYMGNTV